jgi:hypothetical protein
VFFSLLAGYIQQPPQLMILIHYVEKTYIFEPQQATSSSCTRNNQYQPPISWILNGNAVFVNDPDILTQQLFPMFGFCDTKYSSFIRYVLVSILCLFCGFGKNATLRLWDDIPSRGER